MRASALIACVVSVTLAIAAAPACAAGGLRTVGRTTAPVAVDAGTLAYMPSATRVRVIDADLRQRASVLTPPGCIWQTIGGGALLWNCATSDSLVKSAMTYDVRSGQLVTLGTPPVRPPGGSGPEDESWVGIGTDWLAARYAGYHYSYRVFVGRNATTRDDSTDPSLVTNLDRPDLWQRMCAPLKRRMVPSEDFPDSLTLGPYAYRRPYGTALSFHRPFEHPRVILDRCGQQRARVLSRCPHQCTDPVIGDHAVAWIEGASVFDVHPTAARLRVFLVDRKRTLTWRLGRKPATAAILGRRVFATQGGELQTVALPSYRP